MIAGDDAIGFFLPCFSFLTNIKGMNIMWGKGIRFGSISFMELEVEWWYYAEIYWGNGKNNSGELKYDARVVRQRRQQRGWDSERRVSIKICPRKGLAIWDDVTVERIERPPHVVEAVGVHLYQLMAHIPTHFLASRHGHVTGCWPMSF